MLLETQRGAVLDKIDKPKATTKGTDDWFDEIGTLSVDETGNRLLEIDMQLGKLAESQHKVLGGIP